MTSSNGNIFRVTGHLCGKFTGPRSFDVFFDLRLNKRLSKQPWGWWFETPALSLWRHRNVTHWSLEDVAAISNVQQHGGWYLECFEQSSKHCQMISLTSTFAQVMAWCRHVGLDLCRRRSTMSFVHSSMASSCPIVLKVFTKNCNDTTVLGAKSENEWTTH